MSIDINVNCRDAKKHRNEVDDALKEFKKQVKKSGLMQELRKREHYTTPSKARRLKREASFKQRKRDEKKEQYRKSR